MPSPSCSRVHTLHHANPNVPLIIISVWASVAAFALLLIFAVRPWQFSLAPCASGNTTAIRNVRGVRRGQGKSGICMPNPLLLFSRN